MLNFYLPWMPSVNNYYVKTRNGIYLSSSGRKAQQSGIEMIIQQLPDIRRIEYDINLAVVLFPPNARQFDLDNRMKPIQDCMQKSGLIIDDSQIVQLSVYKGEPVKSGLVYCALREGAPILKNHPTHLGLI